MILNSIASWFKQQEVLLLELGNYIAKVFIYSIRKNSTSIKEESSFVLNHYYNCKIRDKSGFVQEIVAGMREVALPQKILVGIDSSHLEHKCFEFEANYNQFGILEKIQTLEQKSLLYSSFKDNKVSVLMLHKPILEDLGISLAEAGLRVSKFVPIKSFAPGDGIRGVIDLGYRSTNLTILNGDFILYYKTLETGIEKVLISVAQKFSISIEKAMLVILEMDLSEIESTKWISVGEITINKGNFTSFFKIYLEALLKKIMIGPITEFKELTLVGWGNEIKGIKQLLEKYKCRTSSVEKSAFILKMG